MKTGDIIRISERKYHAQEKLKVSEGKITAINKSGIIIVKENGLKECFSVGDLICKKQKKEIKINDNWEEIRFKQEGGKIVLFKIAKPNN